FIFFFAPSASPSLSTLSLHDALPIYRPGKLECAIARPDLRQDHLDARNGALGALGRSGQRRPLPAAGQVADGESDDEHPQRDQRSEEHTSELQSLAYLVCRLLLEKKK